MRNIWTIARREYKHYYSSPAAYIISFVFLLVLGIIFYANLGSALVQQQYQQSTPPGIQIIIGPLVTLFFFTIPGLTMNLLSEERRLGTLELMLTYPVKDWELIVGKWLGGFMFVLTVILCTAVYPIILQFMTQGGLDRGLVFTGYLGIILFSAALVALGVAVSSFFSNQVAAFFASLGVFMALWLISLPIQAMGSSSGALIQYLDFSNHFYNSLYEGVFQLSDVVYYLSVTALGLFVGTVVTEIRRWR